MKLKTTFFLLMGTLFVTVAVWWWFRPTTNYKSNFAGNAVPTGLVEFMHPDELRGDFFLVLADAYDHECQNRGTEIHDATVQKQRSGLKGRILLAYEPSMRLAVSKYDIEPPGKHTIIADNTTVYANQDLKRIPKPAAFLISNGQITDVFADEAFDNWLLKNQGDWARRIK